MKKTPLETAGSAQVWGVRRRLTEAGTRQVEGRGLGTGPADWLHDRGFCQAFAGGV